MIKRAASSPGRQQELSPTRCMHFFCQKKATDFENVILDMLSKHMTQCGKSGGQGANNITFGSPSMFVCMFALRAGGIRKFFPRLLGMRSVVAETTNEPLQSAHNDARCTAVRRCLFFFSRGELFNIKRGVRLAFNEKALMKCVNEQADKAMTTTTSEGLVRVKGIKVGISPTFW